MSNYFMNNYQFNKYVCKLIAKRKITYKDAIILIDIFSTSFYYAKDKTKYSNVNTEKFADKVNISISHTYASYKKLIDLNLIKKHIFVGKKEYKSMEQLRKKHPRLRKSSIDIRYEIVETKLLKKHMDKAKTQTLNDVFDDDFNDE